VTKYALYVPVEAGKEKEVADFLHSAVPLVNADAGTISWFAIQERPPGLQFLIRSMTTPGAMRT
jgi:hypothetical protein